MLITVDKIKKNVPISPNIDSSKITPLINPIEKRHISPLIGAVLYADIQTKYNNQTLSGIETELVEYLQLAISFLVIGDLLPLLSFAITEKGIQQQNGINSVPGDNQSTFAALNYIRNELQNKSEFYLEIVKQFLQDNQSSFPLYTAPGNVPDTQSQYDAGFCLYSTNLNITKSYYL